MSNINGSVDVDQAGAMEIRVARHSLDADSVRAAYRRWAGIYDLVFGAVSRRARLAAVAAVNAAQGTTVLEVGVGTGLALPFYSSDKRITGIDLSVEMLERARNRVRSMNLEHVEALLELDAQDTGFDSARFDIAVAMFVASVVPDPQALVRELRRVVRPGGLILFVNHFATDRGPRGLLERALAPASRALGWHPDFSLERLNLSAEDGSHELLLQAKPMPPFGLFQLVSFINPEKLPH